jgi:hypothetical protein
MFSGLPPIADLAALTASGRGLARLNAFRIEAMNAYRFALEQKRPIATFAPDDQDDTSGNRQIIAERTSSEVTEFPGIDTDRFAKWLRGLSSLSWRTMTPLKAHSRSHPYPRPAGDHYIRNLARMNLTNNGVRRLLRAPTSGTALPNARHYAR